MKNVILYETLRSLIYLGAFGFALSRGISGDSLCCSVICLVIAASSFKVS